jgi:hypothetical protein
LHHDNAPFQIPDFLFTREVLTKNYITLVPHPLYFYLFPLERIEPKYLHFDAIEVTEAESQAVLNTLTEHYFQDEFNKWQKCWKRCIREEGDYFYGEGGQ